MCGCLGLTSDIRVRAWKGKSIYRQTSEGEASPALGRARRAGAAAPQPAHLSDLNGTDSSHGSAKAASLLASLHTSIYEQERKQFSSELTKAVYVGRSKPGESVVQRPVNCFMVFPCALIVMALKCHCVHSDGPERDDGKQELAEVNRAAGSEWLTSTLM